MQTVQLAIEDSAFRAALERALFESGAWRVVSVAAPEPERDGVIVLDAEALDRVAGGLGKPERAVLITPRDPRHLARAWDSGIISVVFEDDPVSTAMLAIMSAALRAPHERVANEPGAAAEQVVPRRCQSHRAARPGN